MFDVCKNEDGIITPKNEQRYKTILSLNKGWYITYLFDKIATISDKGMDFVTTLLKKIEKDNDMSLFSNSRHYIELISNVLKNNNEKEKDGKHPFFIH